MARGVTKFVLLMWKNWTLQKRHPLQTAVEILIPVLFTALIVIIRSLVESEEIKDPTLFTQFNPINEFRDEIMKRLQQQGPQINIQPLAVAWTATGHTNDNYTEWLRDVMEYASQKKLFNVVLPRHYETEDVMLSELLDSSLPVMNTTIAAVVFEGSGISCSGDLKMRIRFPGELRSNGQPSPYVNWKTNLLFPVYQMLGPRTPASNGSIGDATPGYEAEGFLALQEGLSEALLENCNTTSFPDVVVNLHRFPYPPYLSDALITALQFLISLLVMLSFVYTCISTVKVITAEKEKQLKEAMKIMGLPGWLHWLAWFIKTLVFLLVSVILIVILLKIKWYPDSDQAVFTYADGTLIFIFLLLYMITSICFCFMISVFFTKANTAATIAGVAWFLSYAPYMFMQQDYENVSLTSKVMACLASNTAMAYGFQLFVMFEGTGQGLQWSDVWSTASQDDNLVIGYILLMLILDSVIYMMITLYIEAVFPGDYGVPRPWYFFVQKSFWCGVPPQSYKGSASNAIPSSSTYEKEPSHLPTGIQIKNLTKVFNKTKTAVNDLSLNMFEGQITVLLGHNGAGKTTTMSMLTGLYTPTSGTAVIDGYDIITDIDGVRDSLGLCPQHNILFDELTVREHLYFFGKLKGMDGEDLEKEIVKYLALLQLEPKEHAPSKTLSGGMKRKLAAGVALCGRSKVVMFDEPTSGMDPAARRAMWDLLQAEKQGRTILLTTHFMDEADLLGDRIAIMAGGELQCCGSSFFLKKKYGAGYHLVVVKGSTCDVNAVTSLLQKHILSITVEQNIGSELTYLLREDQSTLFEKMFSELEDNKERLGIVSYGVSLTTMEEVFMKVGKDQDVKMEDGNYVNGKTNLAFSASLDDGYMEGGYSGQTKVNIQESALLSGVPLVMNQLYAMLLKKALNSLRGWGLLLIQVMLPVFFMIIALIVARSWESSKDLPSLELDLQEYKDPHTIVVTKNAPNDALENLYSSFISHSSGRMITDLTAEDVSDYMTNRFLNESASKLNFVSQNYIVGGSFETNNFGGINATGWFNGQPYHSPPVALNLIMNAQLNISGSSLSRILVANHPLPYTTESKASMQLNGNNVGFQIAFNIGFSLAFVAAYFVMFPIKERVSKSKHLQFVSGVEALSFWFVSFAWDGLMFILPALGIVFTLAAFQEESFSTFEELGRVFLVLMFFGWAMLPYTYLFSFLFSLPATGYTRMTMLNIFGGAAAFMVVVTLATPGIDLKYIADALEWVLTILPHYSVSRSIHNMNVNYQYLKVCENILPNCDLLNATQTHVCCKGHCPSSGCLDFTDNYFDFEAPGISRNLLYFFVTGCCFMLLLVLIEYRVFERQTARKPKQKVDAIPVANGNAKISLLGTTDLMDSDVKEEKEKIQNSDLHHLIKDYALVLKDFTKYYRTFLAVNHLNVAVRKGECFGLLGINGAGKTSTFKMLTGDERISEGDGFVNGLSLSSEMKQVHQLIGYCPQFDALIDNLTGRETLYMFCLLRGIRKNECSYIVNKLADELLFAKHIDKKVKEYSGGNKRKLSTAVALVGDPPIVYLDEPTTGMDPVAKRHLWNVICKVRDSGRCIILTSHSMEECEALCTRIAIMVNGNFKCLGSAQHLKSKFAEGYTLSIKVKKSPKESTLTLTSVDLDPYELQPVKDFVTNSFPGATLREEYQGLLTYYIQSNNLTWAKMFGLMENAKQQLNIEDYSLGQTSLEQVFLTFTKTQRDAI